MARKVERIVEGRLSNIRPRGKAPLNAENDRAFLRSRRSVRMWPVQEEAGMEKGVRAFLTSYLDMPVEVVEGLTIEKIEKQSQARRSKIQAEVLVMLETSQQRDVIQPYVANLAKVQGKAGIRLDIPDYLRGLFCLYEAHAAALRAQYGSVKRAIRFDDSDHSLYMDVKLDDTKWHRISAGEMREIGEKNKARRIPTTSGISPAASTALRRKILLQDQSDPTNDYPHVESEDESESGTTTN